MHNTFDSNVKQLKGLFAAEPCGVFAKALQTNHERGQLIVDAVTQQHLDELHSFVRELPLLTHDLMRTRDQRVDPMLSPEEEEEVGK